MTNKSRADRHDFFESMRILVHEVVWSARDFLSGGSRIFGALLFAAGPAIGLLLGEYVFSVRGYWACGGEVVVVLAIPAVAWFVRALSRASGTSYDSVPVPRRRFTKVDRDEGQVDVSQARLQEMILYVADLEDWLERTGRMS